MPHYRVLVTGCPRSGTRYLERQFLDADLRVRHERMGADGTVSPLFCVDDSFYLDERHPNPLFSTCTFDHIFHLVRDPQDCIPSMAQNMPAKFWHWQEKHTGITGHTPEPLRSALFWESWNDRIERLPGAKLIRLEDWPTVWPEICALLGVPVRPLIEARPGATQHARMLFSDIPDAALREAILKRAARYGYA